MSRTVHHTPPRRRTYDDGWVTAHELTDLRYPSQDERCAAAEGRRPRPRQRTHSFTAYTFPRSRGDSDFVEFARRTHRRRRRTDRRTLAHTRRVLDTAARRTGTAAALAVTDELDPVFTRERHDVAWYVA